MTTPVRQLARELTRLSVDAVSALVVTGRDPGVAGGLLEEAPDRLVLAPGQWTRLAVAAGSAAAGRPTLALLGDTDGAAEGPWDLGGPLVALTDSATVARAAHRAGTRVVRPSWAEDVGPILHAALAHARPCCLHVHGRDVPARPDEFDAPTLGRPRVLAEGDHAFVVASGHLACDLARAAVGLARRGVTLTAVELPMLPPGRFDPVAADRGVLVSRRPHEHADLGADLDERDDLRWVAVGEPGPRSLAEAVLRAVPARRE